MSYWPWPGTTTILEVKCTTSTILSTWAPRSIAMLSLLVTLGSNSMKKLFNLSSGHRLIIIHSDGGNAFGKRGPESDRSPLSRDLAGLGETRFDMHRKFRCPSGYGLQ